jgi:glycogen operon protein
MPVFQYDPSDDNYWGYMPLNFFSPHHGYLSDHTVKAQHNEVREMIKALHQADIEVVLDVVYNHTSEGDHTGPVYSYKGIDNSTYYLMADRPGAPYENFSGTGNTLNCANRYVRKMSNTLHAESLTPEKLVALYEHSDALRELAGNGDRRA